MREIELSDDEWQRLCRDLMNDYLGTLEDYEPPVKLTHNDEYFIYEKGGDDGNDE